jgi:YHS domain-containing protein
MLQNTATKKTVAGENTGKIDDVMVKDPFCQAYFPKRNGLRLKVNGEDLYFCSQQCRDKFVELNDKK